MSEQPAHAWDMEPANDSPGTQVIDPVAALAEHRERMKDAERIIAEVMPYAAETFGIHAYENGGVTDVQFTSFWKGGYSFKEHSGDSDTRQKLDPISSRNIKSWNYPPTQTTEIAMFSPLGTEQYETVTVKETQRVPSPTLFNRGRTIDKVVERQVRQSSGFVPEVCINKNTGQEEPAIRYYYRFDPLNERARMDTMPPAESYEYTKSYGMNASPVVAQVVLPESVAKSLHLYATTKDAGILRRIVGEMAQSSGVLPKEAKFQAPPFSKLPASWPIRIMTVEDHSKSVLCAPKQQLAMPGPFSERQDLW